MLTIKQAKAVRCDALYCDIWHFTCRRCDRHLPSIQEYGKTVLCDDCHSDYNLWFNQRYLKPIMEEWEAMSKEEREGWLDEGYSPLFYVNKYAEFIKKCPVITLSRSLVMIKRYRRIDENE